MTGSIELGWNRLLSLGAAVLALVLCLAGARHVFPQILIMCIISLACIWFSDAIGSYTGILTRVPITKETPGCFITIFGWLFLLATLAGAILQIDAAAKKPP